MIINVAVFVDRFHHASRVTMTGKKQYFAALIGQSIKGDNIAFNKFLENVLNRQFITQIKIEFKIIGNFIGFGCPDPNIWFGDNRITNFFNKGFGFLDSDADLPPCYGYTRFPKTLFHMRFAFDVINPIQLNPRDIKIGSQCGFGLEPMFV